MCLYMCDTVKVGGHVWKGKKIHILPSMLHNDMEES